MMNTSAIIACAGIASFAIATELKSLSGPTINSTNGDFYSIKPA